MKNSHGKTTFIQILTLLGIFLGISELYGQDFTYQAVLNKTQAYVKEPVILTFDIQKTDPSKIMFFNFDVKRSKAYEAHRLDENETDDLKNQKVSYTYLIYPLKSGEIKIDFDLTQKLTTKDKVSAYTFGRRDSMGSLSTIDTPVSIASLTLPVKPLPEGTLLVGDFTLSHTLKTDKAKAYEPLPLTIEIKGKGYPPSKEFRPIPKNEHYTLFEEKPRIDKIYTNLETHSSALYSLALSADKSFILPEIVIKAFDPVKEKSYTLYIPEQSFTITSTDSKMLVDKTDSPEPVRSADWSWLKTLIGYIIVFIAGFLTAKSVQWQKRVQHKVDPLSVQIAQTDDPKVLLALLMAQNSKKYAAAIEKIEAHLYEGKQLNLNELKRELHD